MKKKRGPKIVGGYAAASKGYSVDEDIAQACEGILGFAQKYPEIDNAIQKAINSSRDNKDEQMALIFGWAYFQIYYFAVLDNAAEEKRQKLALVE